MNARPQPFLASPRYPPRLERLRKLSLFAELSVSELAIRTGLLQGKVTICRQGHTDDSYLTDLGPGEFFGEPALLDDFLYMPMTVGRELRMHPLVTVVMIFAGGAVAGVAGLMLVLPVLGVVRVIGETVGVVVMDARLLARHKHALALRRRAAAIDLTPDRPVAGTDRS
jgi:hypothetical protein